jgi:hypothetical protein
MSSTGLLGRMSMKALLTVQNPFLLQDEMGAADNGSCCSFDAPVLCQCPWCWEALEGWRRRDSPTHPGAHPMLSLAVYPETHCASHLFSCLTRDFSDARRSSEGARKQRPLPGANDRESIGRCLAILWPPCPSVCPCSSSPSQLCWPECGGQAGRSPQGYARVSSNTKTCRQHLTDLSTPTASITAQAEDTHTYTSLTHIRTCINACKNT